MRIEETDTYQCIMKPSILTAVIGAMCTDGIALVTDTKIVRGIGKNQQSDIDKKTARDLAHFVVGYTGSRQSFGNFRKFIVRGEKKKVYIS